MGAPLRRFAAAGTAATAVDVGLLLALAGRAGWPVPLADATSIASAATLSFVVNRPVMLAGDTRLRWGERPRLFLTAVAVGGAVDVAVLTAVTAITRPTTPVGLLAAKAVSLGAAASVRFRLYRQAAFLDLRRDQLQPAARPPAPGTYRLTVVVPAYEEAERIATTVRRLRAELGPAVDPTGAGSGLEIVVVDDGSTDATAAVATAAGADQVVRLRPNRGKGGAVRAGVAVAHGRTIAFTDADLSYAPTQLLPLLAGVEDGFDMAVGSRRHVEATTLVRARRVRELSGRVFNVLTSLALLGRYVDTQCGVKAFRSDVARLLFGQGRLDGFAFDVELFHLAERYRLSLTEVPVAVVNRDRSTVRVAVDAARMVRDLFRVRRWSRRGRYDLDPSALARV